MYIPPVNHTILYFNSNKETDSCFDDFVNVPFEDTKEILCELKKILETTKIKDDGQISIYGECISLYDASNVRDKEYDKYEKIKKSLERSLRDILNYKFGESAKTIIYDFDFGDKDLRIGFTKHGDYTDCDTIIFSKSNNNLYLKEDDSLFYGKDIFEYCKDFLSNAYDKLIQFNDLCTQNKYHIPIINSKLKVDIVDSYIKIKKENPDNVFKPYFALLMFSDSITKKINSTDVQDIVKNNEFEIFKRAFVMIENCPKWMQKELYEIRKNQIIEEKRLEEEIKKQKELELKLLEEQKKIELEKQEKKQKKIELVKRIFHFTKK